jgi:NADH dehydrogenase
MAKHKVVILGGGFGGIKTALELADDARFEVVLVSDQTNFRYYPALYQTATGSPKDISDIPLAELFKNKPVQLIKARAERLDRAEKVIHTKGAGNIGYNSLVVALGMTTNYFGIPGLDEFSYGIKSVEEAERFKKHLHSQMIDEHRPDLNYVVIGAGPTGVELAGMLPSYLHKIMKHHGITDRAIRVELVEAAPRILPRSPKDISRVIARRLRKLDITIHTNQKVEAESHDALTVNGKPISSQTVIWTAGVSCNPFLDTNSFAMTDHCKVAVDQFLATNNDVYVIGDNAGTPYSGVAQTALHDGVFVANNLKREADNKPMLAYKPKRPIYVTPAGPNWAAVEWGSLHLHGWWGGLLHKLSYLIGYHDYEPWWSASQRWLATDTEEENCATCTKSVA